MATHNTNVVFIDTSLDTHLALVVSDLDTVSDLKKSILSEHPLCFPKIGQILIHGIKVKRRGYFYHLSDSMLVRSAFSAGCSNKSWFLSVDAAVLGEREPAQNEHFVSHGSPNHVAILGIANNALIASGDDARGFSSKRVSAFDDSRLLHLENKAIEKAEVHVASPCASEYSGKRAVENLDTGVKSTGDNDAAIGFPRSVSEAEEHCVLRDVGGLNVECDVDGPVKGIEGDRTVCEKYPLLSAQSVKRKRKSMRKKEDRVQDDDSKDNAAFVDDPLSFPFKRVSTFDNSQLPQLENKLIENGGLPVASPSVSEHTGKGAVENLGTGVKLSGNNDVANAFPPSVSETENHCILREHLSLNIEGHVDGSGKGIKDNRTVCEENPLISAPSVKRKRKSKMKNEDTVQNDDSKDNASFVDDPLCFPSKKVSTFDNSQLPQLENKLIENGELPVASPSVSEHTGKGAVENLDTGAKLSGNNDVANAFPSSVSETDNHCVLHEHPSLNIEGHVDGSGKGIEDNRTVCEENPLISAPSVKRKRKTMRKKEDTVQDDDSKGNAAFVDNPLSFPSKRVSTFDKSQLPQLENKLIENGELPVASPSVSEHTGKGAVENLGTSVKLSGDNDVANAFPSSVSNVKKRQKRKRKNEDTVLGDDSKENDTYVVGSGNSTIQQDIDVVANPSELADKEVISKTEDLKEHQYTDCKNNNIKNDIDVAVSIKEASEPGLATNKKHKRMKRSLTVEAHEERKESADLFEHKNEKSRDNDEYKDNKATEDILHTDPPAKKKKGKGKSGEKSLSKEKLFNDLNADNASIHVLEDQQKIQNSNAGQSAEHFNDTDLLRTSVRSKRRKGKMNSSNPPETPVVTSSRKEEEADHSGIQRGVQEEISEDGLFSIDISMSKTTIDNVETGTDACKESIHSTEKRTGNYKNHSDFEIKSQTSDVDEPMVLTKDKENAVLDQCHENEAGQIEGAEEGRVVSPQNGSELMLLDNSTLFNQDNTDANIRELNVTSKVVDVNEMTEPVKSEKEKKGMRKNKNSSGQPTPRKGISFTDAFASETVIMKSCSATNCDSMSGNKETEENPLNQTDGEKIKQEEMQGTSDNVDDFSAENACSLEQIKTKSNAEHMDKRQRKKSNNKQTSTSKSISNVLTDQVLDSKKPSESSGNGTPAKPPVAVTKKSMSTSTNFTNKSSKTNLELAKDSVRREPSDSQFNGGSKDSNSRFSSVSKDTVQQFSSGKEQDEANLADDMLVDKMNGKDRIDIETMAIKNMHGLEATTRQTHAEDLSSSQKLSLKEELNVRIHPGKKVPNVHRKDRVNASGKSMDLEKRRELFPVSNSKPKGSIKVVQNKAGKGSGNNVNGVVSKTHQKKSLLAGAIFNYDSSSSSEDEVDASTRTSTDNPLLSDSSDEDSSSGLDSPTGGSYGGQSPENGGRSSLKASFSGTKGMSIDQLLRSSSRFKKAKTTASQLEESQSQPEFNPESLAE